MKTIKRLKSSDSYFFGQSPYLYLTVVRNGRFLSVTNSLDIEPADIIILQRDCTWRKVNAEKFLKKYKHFDLNFNQFS
ncbi:MAG: hypothetical protein ACPGXZ_00720 [Saprospiraceae bacterium]